ncbi:DUF2723 domain-containing protein [Mucilaginibacter hurinus]|uniref:DUF2723 domain-containing protein n=1 Tax=Mucilaginibacter hurinus TaxID=2201324 RepID=A0A367GKX7_9SPHI|nr:DUF2723 domain-containing protein [Mucilaginibacter hurinus]RCH54142.1 DUF2723 domain-containing protein [Mucilaginibacter hurinus]
MPYNKINNLLGWLCFTIASVTYIATLEPSVSFWDCGEFISCAYRLQVSHQPGYPLFAMIGKVFSLLSFGDNSRVAYFTNLCSAIASGATVMFLFWTITALAKKLTAGTGLYRVTSKYRYIAIMGAGLTGALAFAFSDTFWFSAVETIVFALSALCIAVVFWGILKWDAHADEPGADKWLVFIAYVMGLSIGIHLLNLLTIPALTMVYYFRRYNNITFKRGFLVFLLGIAFLAFVQYGIIQYTVKFSGWFDFYFVNTLNFGFGTGAVVFFSLLVGALIAAVIYSIRTKKYYLNVALMCLSFLYFGYSCFAYVPIRAAANPTLNNSHPDNAFTLAGYLNRIQYTPSPLLYGPFYDAKIIDRKDGAAEYRKGDKKYELTGHKQELVWDHNTVFPRMFSNDGQDPQFYQQWMQIPDNRPPNFIDNLGFMFSWQIYQMYVRYFMWNFVGRYNDMDGQQSMAGLDGNWTTGIFDGLRHLPKSVTLSKSYMPLYGLPLIIGLLGMYYHFKYKRRDAVVIALLWFFTGIAIVLYVNQPSVQPRERDYSYVGSFYAFSIWVGLGVIGLAGLLKQKLAERNSVYIAITVSLLFAPVLMACEEWGGHDRSTKLTARDMAYNYLISCPPNAILFTFGDNDTYPLWYAQEVENIRPDVRLVNLSLLTSDWLVRQMQRRINQSAPLPITMPFDKYKDGTRDVIFYSDAKVAGHIELKELFDFITSDDPRTHVEYTSGRHANYLPTKNFKLTVNRDEVENNNVLARGQMRDVADALEWTYNSNLILRNNLTILDILAHNRWERPVCFTVTAGMSNMIGLDNYMYREGFTYRLLPLEPDTTVEDQGAKINSLVMYDNVMNKFKFGNFKHADFLDEQSVTMFYSVLTTTFLTLADGLMAEGRNDLALKVLRRYDDVMPNINPFIDVAARKAFIAQLAYRLGDYQLANKFIGYTFDYLTDEINYNYTKYTSDPRDIDRRMVQFGVHIISNMAGYAKAAKQTALANTLERQLKDYESKFEGILAETEE